MIRIYCTNCSALQSAQIIEQILPCLSTSRQEKVKRLATIEKQAQSTTAGLLLKHALGDVELHYGDNGKPYLTDEGHFFNISHSGDYVVCAISDADIGVDVEGFSPVRPAVLRRCFIEDEQQWIGNDPERFFRLWTMKEAYMKLLGTGFSLPAKEIALAIPPTEGYDAAHECYWQFPDFAIPLTVCSKSADLAEIITINIKDLL